MPGKLTAPQLEMLRIATRPCQRVVRGYKPAEKLAALGYVEIAITEGPYAWIIQATDAGRAYLAALAVPRTDPLTPRTEAREDETP